MGQFKDLDDQALRQVGERIIRNATARVMRQIPSPRNGNPFATGKLARSFNFTWDKLPGGSWELQAHYDQVGDYTIYGTRNYASTTRGQSFFAMRFNGYRRGQGGIQPQGWLSLYGDRPVYEAIVEAELQLTWSTFLNNTISGLTRAR